MVARMLRNWTRFKNLTKFRRRPQKSFFEEVLGSTPQIREMSHFLESATRTHAVHNHCAQTGEPQLAADRVNIVRFRDPLRLVCCNYAYRSSRAMCQSVASKAKLNI
jgi:hypothetical protein